MRGVLAACLLFVAAGTPVLAANEDNDLELIPQATPPAPPPTSASSGSQRNYLEGALSLTPLRDSLAVPFPPPTPASWEGRLFLDTRDEWRLADGLTATYNGRFNLRAANDLPFPSHENVLNELREAYLSWQPEQSSWIDVGRINLKSGVAVGYNPVDFFRSRAVVEPLTADPTVLREDRLGTLMLEGQHVWQGAAITAAFAPRVTLPTAIYRSDDLPNFDPMLDRTNAQDRLLVKGSVTLAAGISPELLVYQAGNRTKFGADLTVGIGQQTVGYVEWAGGMDTDLIDNALSYGRQTGTLPRGAPAVLPDDTAVVFQNDAVVGISYTTEAKITFNFEYHYYQPGFSERDWRRWFAVGQRLGKVPGVASTLWYIRGYAGDQQVPVSRHSAFVRADWVDAFVPDLELTVFANVSLLDGSAFVQANADYHLSDRWSVGALGSFTFGGRRSEYGSLPEVGAVLVRLVRYI